MSQLRIEESYNEKLIEILSNENSYIISDKNIEKLFPITVKSKAKIFFLEPGEVSKNLDSVSQIVEDMYKSGCDRNTVIYAIGGGVVGDLAGFVSGIYMRGIKWINIPTTLLSVIDSSIGGKTGVDHSGYKNLIGLFYKPSEILVFLDFLSSLSNDEWLSGMGEIIKTSFLDSGLYELVQSCFEKIKKRDSLTLKEVIEKCIAVKRKITDLDPYDQNIRRSLNIGHTIGHALEAIDGFKLSHGEYVLWGIKLENEINKAYINSSFYLKMQTMILRALLGREQPKASAAGITELCIMDKKNSDKLICLIAPENVGVIREIKYKPKHFAKELKKCLLEK